MSIHTALHIQLIAITIKDQDLWVRDVQVEVEKSPQIIIKRLLPFLGEYTVHFIIDMGNNTEWGHTISLSPFNKYDKPIIDKLETLNIPFHETK